MNAIPRFALSAAALIAPVAAQSILPYLPQHTCLALSAPDLQTSLDQLRQMPLAKMWAEEEVQNFVADVVQMVEAHVDQALEQGRQMHAQGQLPIDPDAVLQLRMRGATFALTRLEITMGDFGPQPNIGLLLHLDFGASAPQWKPLVTMGLDLLEQRTGGMMTKSEATVGEWPVVTFTPTDVQAGPMVLSVGTLPEGIVIGTLADEVRATIENVQAKKPALANDASFASATGHLPTDGAEMVAFVRPDPLLDLVLSGLRIAAENHPQFAAIDMDGVERALAAMGLRNLPTQITTSSYVDGKSVTRMFQGRAGAQSEGTTAAGKQIDLSLLRWVPKDAVGFSGATFDVTSLYDSGIKGLQAYDPEIANKALAQLAEIEKQVGFRVRDDLIGSLGDHYLTWSMPVGTIQSAPEMAFLLAVRDADKFVQVLQALTKLSEGAVELEKSEKRGVEVYQLRFDIDAGQGFAMNWLQQFTPTFAFKNGYMVGGFSASDIKRVFQRMDREDDPKGDIRSNKEFAAVASQLPAGLDSVSFTDWKTNFESLYQLVASVLSFIPLGDEVPIDTSLLPDSATLTKHLFGGVSYGRAVPGGYEWYSSGPFGPELVVLISGAIGAGAAMLGASQSRPF